MQLSTSTRFECSDKIDTNHWNLTMQNNVLVALYMDFTSSKTSLFYSILDQETGKCNSTLVTESSRVFFPQLSFVNNSNIAILYSTPNATLYNIYYSNINIYTGHKTTALICSGNCKGHGIKLTKIRLQLHGIKIMVPAQLHMQDSTPVLLSIPIH